MTRYIFITGGVVSSLGKGLASALQEREKALAAIEAALRAALAAGDLAAAEAGALAAAGFTDITSTELDVEAQLGDTFIQDAFTVDLVLEEHKSEARALVEQHKAQFRHGDGYRVVLPMLVIQATKPAS